MTSVNSTKNQTFILKADCNSFFANKYHIEIDDNKLRFLFDNYLIPVYLENKEELVLVSDVFDLLPVSTVSNGSSSILNMSGQLFEKEVFNPCPSIQIDLSADDVNIDHVFYAALRNLLKNAEKFNKCDIDPISHKYFSSTRVLTCSQSVDDYINRQIARGKKADMSQISQFTKSAHYMGSKRSLASFLVEAISYYIDTNSTVVDLMCGSGVTSGAFSQFWNVISSDAQEFCQILSLIHSGGYDVEKANILLKQIIPKAKEHAELLQGVLAASLYQEDEIFHSDINNSLIRQYHNFIDSFPTISNSKSIKSWDPTLEVKKRRIDNKLVPYCLFTTYFANIYFGVRQSIEIDSLRYAIDTLDNEKDKVWALGALIPTISDLGTTFGGHFAQPRIRSGNDINMSNISAIVDRRSFSITHEFSVRLLNLAEASQHKEREIMILNGPWENALASVKNKVKSNDILVYIDAPYKKEDYSRFYHVIETLVKYKYHSCIGVAKAPNIREGERFKSEFATKDKLKLSDTFVKIIKQILANGWRCAWSYSNDGDANIVSTINDICGQNKIKVSSYATPYTYKSHGGRKHKNFSEYNKRVIEYLIIFEPLSNA